MKKFSIKSILIGLGVFLSAVAIGFMFLKGSKTVLTGNEVEVDWRMLGELDYISGKASGELATLDGKMVRIPGFMVPLEDNQKKVKEFLLVPSPQACIHVPPPPPNQMVLIEMQSEDTEPAFGPIWTYGILRIKSKRHMYGEASFVMEGMKIEPYR